MGNKKDDYKEFCRKFAAHMTCEDDWWGMLVGGSDDRASPRQESYTSAAVHGPVLALA